MMTRYKNREVFRAVLAALATPYQGERGYTLEFARFSTTLHRFRPDIPFGKHGSIYQNACACQVMAVAEEACKFRLAELQEMPLPEQLRRQPGIIATYHVGSYRLLPRWLHSQGLPFSLVVSHAVKHQQGPRYHRLANHSRPERFDIIDAERPDALLLMRRALQSGKYLVVYVDGNTGALSQPKRNTAVVDFYDTGMRVRTGMAHLAYLTGVPFYPMAHHAWHSQGTRFWVGDAIHPEPSQPRAQQAVAMMQGLYAFLERIIHTRPGQWEGWFYTHDFVPDFPESFGLAALPGSSTWIGVEVGKELYWLDRKSGFAHPQP